LLGLRHPKLTLDICIEKSGNSGNDAAEGVVCGDGRSPGEFAETILCTRFLASECFPGGVLAELASLQYITQ
jgi:hypothetical protein